MFPNLIKPAGLGGSASGFSPEIAPLLGRGEIPLISATADDANINVGDIGFGFRIYSQTYQSNIFIGSNSYITFGFGSSAYSSISRTNPGQGLLVMALDRSWNYVTASQSPGSYRVRWEGNESSSGGIPYVWEATFFANGVIQLAIAAQIQAAGVSTLTKGDGTAFTDYVVDSSPASFVFLPNDADGNSHTVQVGSYVL